MAVVSIPSGTITSDLFANNVANATTVGHSVAPETGSNRMALACWMREGGSFTTWDFTGCSWGGETGTQVLQIDEANGGSTTSRVIAVYRFMESQIANISGSQGVTVTATDSANPNTGLFFCQFSGVDQTTPIGTPVTVEQDASYSTTPDSAATLTVPADGLGLWLLVWGNATTATWSGATEMFDVNPQSAYTITGAYSTSSATGSAVPAATSTLGQVLAAFAINPAGGGGGGGGSPLLKFLILGG